MSLTEKNLVSLFFPTACMGCDAALGASRAGQLEPPIHSAVSRSLIAANGNAGFDFDSQFRKHWCDDCWQSMRVGQELQCVRCAAVIRSVNPVADGCPLCRTAQLKFAQAVALGNYDGKLQELVIRMKNQHDEPLAIQLGQLIAFSVLQSPVVDRVDLVLPVPTHWQRRFRRGFCAAEVIAESVASTCQLDYSKRRLKCDRKTQKQGTLSISGRIQNVKNAFRVRNSASLVDRRILLVDDVMTSGATTSEIAKVLKRAGATSVDVAVVARGAGAR